MILLLGGLFMLQQAANAWAREPHREAVDFFYTWDVGLGRSVYVVGNVPELGLWNPMESVRLYWTPGNVWTGQIGVLAGTTIEYKYIARTNSVTAHCHAANVQWIGGPNLQRTIPAQADAPFTGKTVYYLSSWPEAHIHYRVGEDFIDAVMEAVGPGRQAGESLYKVSEIGIPGAPLEFVFFNPAGEETLWDNAPYPGFGDDNYFTWLDVFYVQDGQVFNYTPPPSISPPRLITNLVTSTVSGIPNRNLRIWLPRGYDENTWKRYPVLYMHDGQNVFDPGGGYGSWNVNQHAEREMHQGRMREAIIVGINNTGNRLSEYCPPGDAVTLNSTTHHGIADLYGQFLVNDVRPLVDGAFRTLTNAANTAIAGSSMGGLVSTYIGLEFSDQFGLIGGMSSSFWAAEEFRQRLATLPVQGRRVYLDAGTAEGTSVWHIWTVRDHLLRAGYVERKDLWSVIECGAAHNEAAWSGRFGLAAQYLLPLHDEANTLIHDEVPLVMDEVTTLPEGEWRVSYPSFAGWSYQLEVTDSLTAPDWVPIAASAVEKRPWHIRHLDALLPVSPGTYLYRLTTDAESGRP